MFTCMFAGNVVFSPLVVDHYVNGCLIKKVQWNPVNLVTIGPQISIGINGVAALKGYFQ